MDGHEWVGDLGRRSMRLAMVMLSVTLCAIPPASAQTTGEAHAVVVRGADSAFDFNGLSGGGGVLLRNQFGVEGEVGVIVDNSDERDMVPVLSLGGSLHLASRRTVRKLVPFVGAGLSSHAGRPGWYGGGGAHYWFRRATALRVEVRGVAPTADGYPRKAWFLRGGLAFGVAR